ncbi:MAG: hypothetical protein K0Q50_2963, partial [Vampirovibrio sp.]|nr:hypothetical protein [Vampirovibrio sp.]
RLRLHQARLKRLDRCLGTIIHGQVISVLTAQAGNGFLNLGNLFENDKSFEQLSSGFVQQASLLNPTLNAVEATRYHTEQKGAVSTNWWDGAVSWLKGLPWNLVIIGLVVAFFFLLILPMLIRAIFRR